MESNPLEISVDLGNLPRLLKSLGDSVNALQANVYEIGHTMRMETDTPSDILYSELTSNKHENMLMKQSILATEIQECETRGTEQKEALLALQDRLHLLDVNMRALSNSGLDNSLRLDQIASVSKALEKDHIDIVHEAKLHSIKISEMLTAARDCEASWFETSQKVEIALTRMDSIHARTETLQEQIQSMIEDNSSRNSHLNRMVESSLRQIDAKCQSSLSDIRRELLLKTESLSSGDEVARVSRMYRRIIADVKARRSRESFNVSIIQEWRSETTKGIQKKVCLRRLVRIANDKLKVVFYALRLHNQEIGMIEKINRVCDDLVKSHEATILQTKELSIETASTGACIETLHGKLNACMDSIEDLKKSFDDNKSSSRLETVFEDRLRSVEERLAREIECVRSERPLKGEESDRVQETSGNASVSQIQEMLKDLLILWDSLREVDTKKMDKEVFNEEIGSLSSQICIMKADILNLKNILDQDRYQWRSTSTVATLNHHPSDTLITRESAEIPERPVGKQDFERLLDFAKTILSDSNPTRKAKTGSSRSSSIAAGRVPREPLNQKPMQIVARKIL